MSDTDKLILVDCDGVLLNWEYAFDAFLKGRGHKRISGIHTEYDIAKRYNIPKDRCYEYVKEFNSSAAMAFLPPLRDAVEYVTKLHREHGYMFHVITSMSSNCYAQNLRKMNLEKVFGEGIFERYTFLPLDSGKKKELEEYEDSWLLWVEDNVYNSVVGLDLGLNSVMIEHSYNMIRPGIEKDCPQWEKSLQIPRFTNWKGIYEHVIGV